MSNNSTYSDDMDILTKNTGTRPSLGESIRQGLESKRTQQNITKLGNRTETLARRQNEQQIQNNQMLRNQQRIMNQQEQIRKIQDQRDTQNNILQNLTTGATSSTDQLNLKQKSIENQINLLSDRVQNNTDQYKATNVKLKNDFGEFGRKLRKENETKFNTVKEGFKTDLKLQETLFSRRLKTERDARNELDTRFQKWGTNISGSINKEIENRKELDKRFQNFGKDQYNFNKDIDKRFVDWGTKVSEYEQSTFKLNKKQDELLARQEEVNKTQTDNIKTLGGLIESMQSDNNNLENEIKNTVAKLEESTDETDKNLEDATKRTNKMIKEQNSFIARLDEKQKKINQQQELKNKKFNNLIKSNMMNRDKNEKTLGQLINETNEVKQDNDRYKLFIKKIGEKIDKIETKSEEESNQLKAEVTVLKSDNLKASQQINNLKSLDESEKIKKELASIRQNQNRIMIRLNEMDKRIKSNNWRSLLGYI